MPEMAFFAEQLAFQLRIRFKSGRPPVVRLRTPGSFSPLRARAFGPPRCAVPRRHAMLWPTGARVSAANRRSSASTSAAAKSRTHLSNNRSLSSFHTAMACHGIRSISIMQRTGVHHLSATVLTASCIVASCLGMAPAAEIIQLAEGTWDDAVPQGKEVDCIYGDWVLRNDRSWP